ncbi:unnamed protein product [Owenia fusiformis]|uniref:Uncharacterized protein n=1 Tax=Owenia fusiformis TaxID=6347 RepID=A0A8J1TF41_OWEFU|nr:unnamed protein product [Owenia fusiformis]
MARLMIAEALIIWLNYFQLVSSTSRSITLIDNIGTEVDVLDAIPAKFGELFGQDVTFQGTLVVTDTAEACYPLNNPCDIVGKIAVVKRGTCNFIYKAYNAERAGAIGVIVMNSPGRNALIMKGQSCPPESDVTIPAVFLDHSEVATLINHMTAYPDLIGRIASRGNAVGASCTGQGPSSCRGYPVAVTGCPSNLCTCNGPWFVPASNGCERDTSVSLSTFFNYPSCSTVPVGGTCGPAAQICVGFPSSQCINGICSGGVCYNIECDFVWSCHQSYIPTQSPVCLPTRDSRGCCEGCAGGLIDASASFVATHDDARTILNRISTFTLTEQGLINSLFASPLNSNANANLLSNMVVLFDNFDYGGDPCTFGRGAAPGVWDIHNTAVALLALLDDPARPPLHDPEDSKRIDEYRKKMLWINNCMFPRVLELKGLECFKDDDCNDGVCKDDCSACVQCRTNNDCTDPTKPNCRQNGAGIMICGDPHISQTIKGTDHRRLCYDFFGKPGSEYLFLRDHDIDIKSTFVEDEAVENGFLVEYVGNIAVARKGVLVSISPDKVVVETSEEQTNYSWKEQIVELDDAWMTVKRKQIQISFNNATTTLVVTRKGRAKSSPFLNFGVTEKTGLSRDAGGIMGWIGNEAIFNDDGSDSGQVTFGNITIPVHDSRDGCLRIDEEYLNKFSSILQMFEIE